MKCQECGKDGTGDVCASCGGTIEESPRWYAEGIAHLTEQKQYAIAFDLLEEGIERYPQSAMLWFNGGVLEELLNNRDAAITRYQKVLELRPNNEKAKKALERLLGRPLYAPPPTTSYAATQTEAPAAPPPAQTTTAPPPAASPVAAPVADAPPLAVEAPPALPAVGPNGAELAPVDAPPTEVPTLPMLPGELPGGPPWGLIRAVCGIAAIVTFLAMLVTMIALNEKGATLFTIALLLFCVTLVLFYVASAFANTPTHRRRR
jgi:hypothetical protein